MTRDGYLTMCEQRGEEPNPDKIPPDIEDFPPEIQQGIALFNQLGDRIYPEVGYVGKDYSALDAYFEAYEIEDKVLFIELLTRLDQKLIENSQKEMKAQRDKIKKSSKGHRPNG